MVSFPSNFDAMGKALLRIILVNLAFGLQYKFLSIDVIFLIEKSMMIFLEYFTLGNTIMNFC
jgi:hypothetical protein